MFPVSSDADLAYYDVGRCCEIIDVTINSASNIMVALLGGLQDLVDNIGKGEITAGVQWTRSGHLEKEE